jgi:putative alpha-1,2-mannosidase
MSSLYRDAGGGLPGNDDLGALSSWYVWAALGAYPETPGVAGLALAAPIFPAVTLHYATGRTLRFITLPAVRPEHPNAPIATLDGRPLTSAWLALSRLHTNSTMVFWR